MRRRRVLWGAGILVGAVLLVVWLATIVVQHAAARAFGPELTALCQGYASATELPGTAPDGKLIVLQGNGKRIHTWHNALPDERRADSADEVDYVVCIRESSYTVEVCRYTMGGRVKRIRRGYEILFADPELGAPAAFEQIYGPSPDRCPDSKGPSLLTATIRGDRPRFTYTEFASLLEASSAGGLDTPVEGQAPGLNAEEPQPQISLPEPTQEPVPVASPEPAVRQPVEEAQPRVEIRPEPTRIDEAAAEEPPEAIVTPGSQPPETAELTGSPSLWSGPDHLGEHMGIILKEGERVEILATTKEWTQVRWMSPEGKEVIGWALSQFVGRP